MSSSCRAPATFLVNKLAPCQLKTIDPASSLPVEGLLQPVGMHQAAENLSLTPVDDSTRNAIVVASTETELQTGPQPVVHNVEASVYSEDAAAITEEDALNEHEKANLPKNSTLLRRRIVVVSCFAFVTGWADVLALIHFGAFAALMTGNIIALGASLSSGVEYAHLLTKGEPGWYYLVVIGSNVFGAFMACWIQETGTTNAENRGWRRVWKSTTYRTALFAFIMTISGAIVIYLTGSRYAILLFAPALGAQNTFTAYTKEVNIPTAFMTGNTQKAGILIAKMKVFSGKEPPPRTLEDHLVDLVPLLASFSTLVGAIFGGLLTRATPQFSLGASSLLIAFVQVIPYVLTDLLLIRDKP